MATVSLTSQSIDESPWGPAYRLLTIGIVLTITGAAFEALAVATVMPTVVDDLGGLSYYGWTFSAFMLTNMIGLAFAGNEADLHGPARPFLIGVGMFTIGLIVAGLAPSMPVLIAGRALQGFGGGVITSVAYVVMGRGYPGSARPKLLALLSTAWVVPGLVGPAIAAVISDVAGWRWVFLGIVPIPIFAAMMAWRAISSIPAGSAITRDWARLRNAVLLATGVAALLAGFQATTILLGIPLVVVGAAVAFPALKRIMPEGTLRGVAGAPAAIATMGLLNLGFFGVDAFVPLALTDIRDRSSAFAGLALTAATVTWTAGSWLQARYSSKLSRRLLVRTGLSILVLGIALTLATLSYSVPAILGPIAWGIAGLGMGIAYSTISLVVLESSPPGQEGTTTSAMSLANTVGIAMGTGIGGILIAALSSDDTVSRASLAIQDVLMMGVIALGIVVAARLPARPPVKEPAGEAVSAAPDARPAPSPSVARPEPVRAFEDDPLTPRPPSSRSSVAREGGRGDAAAYMYGPGIARVATCHPELFEGPERRQ